MLTVYSGAKFSAGVIFIKFAADRRCYEDRTSVSDDRSLRVFYRWARLLKS